MSYNQPLRGDDISIVTEIDDAILITSPKGEAIVDWSVNINDQYKIKSIRVPAGLAVNLYNP